MATLPTQPSDDQPAPPDTKMLAGNEGVNRSTALPSHFPAWAAKLAELYFSGTTSTFVLHGNTFDVVPATPATEATQRYVGLADFLAEQIFGRWDLVIHYDLARGLRCLAGGNCQSLDRRLASVATRSDQSPRRD